VEGLKGKYFQKGGEKKDQTRPTKRTKKKGCPINTNLADEEEAIKPSEQNESD